MDSTENTEMVIRELQIDAEQFYRRLREIKDDSPRFQRWRIEFIEHTKALVAAWRTFAHVYYKVPVNQAFEHLLKNLLNDNREIIASLNQKLSNAIVADRRRRHVTKRFFFLRSPEFLSPLFIDGKWELRHRQVLYAAAVVNLLSSVVRSEYSKPNEYAFSH